MNKTELKDSKTKERIPVIQKFPKCTKIKYASNSTQLKHFQAPILFILQIKYYSVNEYVLNHTPTSQRRKYKT